MFHPISLGSRYVSSEESYWVGGWGPGMERALDASTEGGGLDDDAGMGEKAGFMEPRGLVVYIMNYIYTFFIILFLSVRPSILP